MPPPDTSYLTGQRVRTPRGIGRIVWYFPVLHRRGIEAYTVQLRRTPRPTVFYARELRAA